MAHCLIQYTRRIQILIISDSPYVFSLAKWSNSWKFCFGTLQVDVCVHMHSCCWTSSGFFCLNKEFMCISVWTINFVTHTPIWLRWLPVVLFLLSVVRVCSWDGGWAYNSVLLRTVEFDPQALLFSKLICIEPSWLVIIKGSPWATLVSV